MLWSCVFYRATSQRELCVFWEQECFLLFNSKTRLLLTVTLLCWKDSCQCYCVLTGSYFHSPAVSKAGWRKKTSLQMPTHDSTCTPIHVCAKSLSDRHTQTLTLTETLGPEQWYATAQDVYVTSCVCEKLGGVAVETKCNIEKSPLSLSFCGSLPLCREKPVHKGEPGLIPDSGCSCQTVSDDTRQRPSVRQRYAGGSGELGWN